MNILEKKHDHILLSVNKFTLSEHTLYSEYREKYIKEFGHMKTGKEY
jgi:hypothetical protein